jgi:malate dehydrogenase (oxaloacetate-decarboxylating)(NADP+)
MRSPSLPASRCPEEVAVAYGRTQQFGRDYIIPAPFDPAADGGRASAVAKAAMDSAWRRLPIEDFALTG